MSAPYQNTQAEKYARWRRRDHANLEAMQNLIFDAVSVESGVEFRPRLRSFISALQSAHGGGEVINEPFERSHKTVASYMQFTGTDEAKAARVRRLINELEDYQDASGYRFFFITRGGNPTGEKDSHGNDLYSATEYVDLLKPVADSAVVAARESEQWRGDKAKNIKAHPGLALAAQVNDALSKLPRIDVQTDTPTKPAKKKMSVVAYREQRDPRLLASIEAWADGIEERAGDDDLALEWLEVQVKRMRESRLKTRAARHDDESLGDAAGFGKARMSYKTDASARVTTAAPGVSHCKVPPPTKMSPLTAESSSEVNELENTPDTTMLDAALECAALGISVFPLHDVFDGICSCRCSPKKCPRGVHKCADYCTNKGKHPRTPHGLADATTDEKQIRAWWSRWPLANIGAAMGGPLRLVGLDFDPKNGGSTSLADLTATYGDEWHRTRVHRTGSLGYHFLYQYPAGVELRNTASEIGPGVDTRAEGGYLVWPPSTHETGRLYSLETDLPYLPAPQFILDTATKDKPAQVVEFQDARPQVGAAFGRYFADGERNNGLRDVACGRWLYGYAKDEQELYEQLLGVRDTRCAPGKDLPATDAELRELVRRTARKYARASLQSSRVEGSA